MDRTMAFKNDLSDELDSEAHSDPASAAPKLHQLVRQLLNERFAYRLVLESIAHKRCTDLPLIQERSKDVCEEFVA